jgi:hypothetical protein
MAEEEMAMQEQAAPEPAPEPAPTTKKTTIEEKSEPPTAEKAAAPNWAALGQKALGFAKANKGMVAGAALGAGAGVANGDGVTGALGGAVGGAALGAGAQVGAGAVKRLQSRGGPLTMNSVGGALKSSYNGQVAASARGMGYTSQQAQGMMVGLKKPAAGVVTPAPGQPQVAGLLPAPKA